MDGMVQEKRTLLTAHQSLMQKGNMVDEIYRLSEDILSKLKRTDGDTKNKDIDPIDPSPKRDDIVDLFYNISEDLERRSEKTLKVLYEIKEMIG